MSEFKDFISEGLNDFLEAMGETFLWNGQPYACAIDHVNHTLTTAKSLFPGGVYPKRGDSIRVAGKTRQVTKLANSALRAAAGGMVEDQPFVDDPSDPAIDIVFDKFVKK